MKDERMVNNKYPAVIFAAKRRPNETGLIKFEIISIPISEEDESPFEQTINGYENLISSLYCP